MKANAPEKIYIFEEDLQREDHIVMYGINQDKDIRGLVEYIHADAFVEKACGYFRRGLEDTKVIDDYRNILVRGIQASYTSVEEFIENFKEYIEGE